MVDLNRGRYVLEGVDAARRRNNLLLSLLIIKCYFENDFLDHAYVRTKAFVV